MLCLLIVTFFLTNMCPPKTLKGRVDALNREIEHQEYLEADFDCCDYVEPNKLIETQNGDLTVVQLNVRGITSKQSRLKELIDSSFHTVAPDILLLYETWLNPFSPELHINGYETYRCDRVNRKGGGVAILAST